MTERRTGSRVVRAGAVRAVGTPQADAALELAARERQAELARLLAGARAEGHAAGVAETLAQGAAATLRAASAVEALTAEVAARDEREVTATSRAVVGLGLLVAQWVLRHELSAAGAGLLARLEEALTALLPSPQTRLSVSHADHALVAEWAASRGRVGTEVVADARLAPGEAVVVTDAGSAELTVAAALRAAAEALTRPGDDPQDEDAVPAAQPPLAAPPPAPAGAGSEPEEAAA